MQRLISYDLDHCEVIAFEVTPGNCEVRVVHRGENESMKVRVLRFPTPAGAFECASALADAYDDAPGIPLTDQERSIASTSIVSLML